MIIVNKLHKHYKMKGSKAYHALKGVSIKFPNKGFVFITGKSGCGKSTLLNIIGGLDTYDKGSLIIRGRSTKEFSNTDFDNYRNSYLGFIFQDFHLIDGETIEENVSLALKLQGYTKEEIPKRVKHFLKLVDLYDKKHHKISEISGGQKQRVAIARALVKNPQVIIADEPTGNLDSKTSLLIMNILKKLSVSKLVIMVTHDTDYATQFADRVIILKDGKVVQDTEKMIEGKRQLDYTPLKKLRFKKSTFPLNVALRMALKSVFRKKFKLIFTVILFAISIGLFAFATSFNFYNTEEIFYQSIKDSQTTTIEFSEGYDEEYNMKNILDEEGISQLKVRYPNVSFASVSQGSAFRVNSCGFESNLCYYGGKVVFLDDVSPLNLNIIHGSINSSDDGIIISDITATYLMNALNITDLSELINLSITDIKETNIITEFSQGYIKAIYETGKLDLVKTIDRQMKHNEFRDYQTLESLYSLYTYAPTKMNNQVDSYGFDLSNGNAILGEKKIQVNDTVIIEEMEINYYNVADRFGAHYVGKLPTNDNEVAFSYNKLFTMFSIQLEQLVNKGEITSNTMENILSPYYFNNYESVCSVQNDTYNLESCDTLLNDFLIDANDYFGLVGHDFTLEFTPVVYSRKTYEQVELTSTTFNKITAISIDTNIGLVISKELLKDYLEEKSEEEGSHFRNRHYVVAQFSNNIKQHEAFIKTLQRDYRHTTPASNAIRMLSEFMDQRVRNVFFIISLVFGGFASLLMFSYINQSISFKRADIGTLRAIGAKGTDVSKIFVTEAMIISMISSVIGIIGLNYVIFKLNDVVTDSANLNFKVFYVHGFVYVILLLFAAGVALFSCALPLYRLIRMNPIDVIRKARD